jgi:hypothetical protein
VLVGTTVLAIATVRRRSDTGTLLLLWFAVPFVMISFGSSKLYHYTYPFLPPLAIGAGYLASLLVHRDSVMARAVGAAGNRLMGTRSQSIRTRLPRLGHILITVGVLAFLAAAVTILIGRFSLRIGDVLLFRNASVVRPLVIGTVLLLLAGRGRLAGQFLGGMLVLFMLPVAAYRGVLKDLDHRDEPMQVIRACILAHSGADREPGIYVHAEDVFQWRYVYYFRDLGWRHPNRQDEPGLAMRLFDDQPPLVLLTAGDYARFEARLRTDPAGLVAETDMAPEVMLHRLRQFPTVQFDDGLILLMPDAYAACALSIGR